MERPNEREPFHQAPPDATPALASTTQPPPAAATQQLAPAPSLCVPPPVQPEEAEEELLDYGEAEDLDNFEFDTAMVINGAKGGSDLRAEHASPALASGPRPSLSLEALCGGSGGSADLNVGQASPAPASSSLPPSASTT